MIVLEGITKVYKMGESEVRALDGVDLHIYPHEFVAIIGPSGSGKSTLMNMIGCLDVPTSGRYWIDGVEGSKMSDNQLADLRNKKLGFIFQQYNLLPKLTVLENVELPLLYAGLSDAEQEKRAISKTPCNTLPRFSLNIIIDLFSTTYHYLISFAKVHIFIRSLTSQVFIANNLKLLPMLTHETFFHTAVLSLRLHKGESPFGLKTLNIYHFQTSCHQLTCHRPNRKNSQSIGIFQE